MRPKKEGLLVLCDEIQDRLVKRLGLLPIDRMARLVNDGELAVGDALLDNTRERGGR